MQKTILIIVAVVLVGCGESKEDGNSGVIKPNLPSPEAVPEKLITDPIVEKAVRKSLNKPKGELTEEDLAKVTRHNFFGTQITNAGLKEVAKLQKLTHLVLYDTQITDEGLKEIAKLPQLTSFGLQNTKITDAGLKEVAKMKQLTVLDLSGTKVTKAGVDELQKALPKCTIHSNPAN